MLDGFKGSSGLAKMMTIFVVGTLLGLGLCVVSASLEQSIQVLRADS